MKKTGEQAQKDQQVSTLQTYLVNRGDSMKIHDGKQGDSPNYKLRQNLGRVEDQDQQIPSGFSHDQKVQKSDQGFLALGQQRISQINDDQYLNARKSEATSSSLIQNDEDIVLIEGKEKQTTPCKQDKSNLYRQKSPRRQPSVENKNGNTLLLGQSNFLHWQNDFTKLKESDCNNDFSMEQGSSARFGSNLKDGYDKYPQNRNTNDEEELKFQGRAQDETPIEKKDREEKQLSIRTDGNTLYDRENSSSFQYDSPIPSGFQGSHNLDNIKSLIKLNQINFELANHIQRFDQILEKSKMTASLKQTQIINDAQLQKQQAPDSFIRTRSKQDMNKTPQAIQESHLLRYPSQQERKCSSFYSVSQQSSINNILIDPSKNLKQQKEQEIDELVLGDRSSLQTNAQNQRFNKQFFDELKNTQIGFATILKERQSTTFVHTTLVKAQNQVIDNEDMEFPDNEHQNLKLLLEQNQIITRGNDLLGDEWNLKKKNSNFLTDLLLRIEYNNQLKKSVERAIIMFNEKPKKGVDFLIKNQFLDANPSLIAEFLLTTPGLSKFAIGVYIGMNDPFCISVMKEFCNKIDFSDMEVDEAMRLFLQQFRLPGESQQIDRILEQFSNTYYNDNKENFENVDGVYVLAYSLIFLNTLNHNPNVQASRKLTKQQFVQQNKHANPNFPTKKLEEMYDRILKNQFKTDTLFVEKIYERIRAFNHEETTKETIKLSTNVLQSGETFLKYGRVGKPHLRFVYVSDDEQNLFWCIQKPNNRKSKIKCIRCDDIIDIKVGYNSTQVLVRHNIPIEFDDLIFSIITRTRTLDLQAGNSEIRNRWVKFLKIILNENLQKQKLRDVSNNLEAYERKQRIQHDLEEIWENDIMANFAQHWDYQNHCPKKQVKDTPYHKKSTSTKEKNVKKSSWMCKIHPKHCWMDKHSRMLKKEGTLRDTDIYYKSNYENSPEKDLDLDVQTQGFFLEILWRRGIPPRFRRKVWPFAISNKLEISKQLYRINLKEGLSIVSSVQKGLRKQKKNISKQILEKIDHDIKNTLQCFKLYFFRESNLTNKMRQRDYEHEEAKSIFDIAKSADKSRIDDQETIKELPEDHYSSSLKYESLFNLIVAFIMQRPDIGYLPNISFLAGVFLIYCNEYDSYASFTNFIHSHYFLDLFKGQLSDIKIRINQFNKHFQKLMPDLFKHFETLDITTDLFLIDWMLTLYSKNMDLDIVSRIWDNFMLDGEIFAIKTGLAILQYFENQFLKMSYFQIIKQLKNLSGGLLEEDKFFNIIESIKIDHSVYYEDIKMQKWSYQKSKVLGSVFM